MPASSRADAQVPQKTATQQAPDSYGPIKVSRSASVDPQQFSSFSTGNITRAVQPSYLRHHTTCDTVPQQQRSQQPQRPRGNMRASSYSAPATNSKDANQTESRMAPCMKRTASMRSSSPRYTLVGAENLSFCKLCLDYIGKFVGTSQFRERAPSGDHDRPVQCALGNDIWIQLAWSLACGPQSSDPRAPPPDLHRLREVAKVDEKFEACPGFGDHRRTWYGILDANQKVVDQFRVCRCDLQKIRRLMPKVSELLVRLPDFMLRCEHSCSIRADSKRANMYLGCMQGMEEAAVAANKVADPTPLIKLIEDRPRFRECPRDCIREVQLWHFMDTFPDLTICEECFDLIVEPEIEKGQPIARLFNRAVQPLSSYDVVGRSCQLYSPRMRRIFRDAVKSNDLEYLKDKAMRRREMEVYLRQRRETAEDDVGYYKDHFGERHYKTLEAQARLAETEERTVARWREVA